MIETSHQRRKRLLAEIKSIYGLESERVLTQQLESFSELAVEVTHRLIMRADNGRYWLGRCESAEAHIAGELSGCTN